MLTLWLTVALGADWYVQAGASGSGSAPTDAFGSIQQGMDAAQPGDTVHVADGQYAPFSSVRDGSATARIRVVADNPRGPVVLAPGGTALDNDHTHHTYEGLVFDGDYGGDDVLKMGGSDGLELLDVEVRRAYDGDCIDLRSVSDVLIADADIHHCVNGTPTVQADSHGITGDSVFDLTVRDSRIWLVAGDAFQISPPRDAWDSIRIERTQMWTGALDEDAAAMPAGTIIGENAVDTKTADDAPYPRLELVDVEAWGWQGHPVISNMAAFNLKERVDVLVERVTVWDSEIAFRLREPADVTVRNAVVHDTQTAFRLEDGIGQTEILAVTVGEGVDEVFRDANGAPVDLDVRNLLHLGPIGEDSWTFTGPVELADPSDFVDAASDDYHLASTASWIDAGETLTGFADDRDGLPRPVGAGWDVGAFEVQPDVPTGTGTATGGTGAGTGGGTGTGTGGVSDTGAEPAKDGCGCATVDRPGLAGIAVLVLAGLRRRR